MMNTEEISLSEEKLSWLTKIKTMRSHDLISSNKACFAISLGTSVVLTAVGFYWFTVSIENAYILFLATFFSMFLLILKIRRL